MFFKNYTTQVNAKKIPETKLESTYKAAVLKALKQPLVIEELKPKKLKKNEVRIKVKYCSVNSVDIESCNFDGTKLPFIPGNEFSGEVIEVGESVDKTMAQCGDRVAVLSENNGGLAEQCVVCNFFIILIRKLNNFTRLVILEQIFGLLMKKFSSQEFFKQ